MTATASADPVPDPADPTEPVRAKPALSRHGWEVDLTGYLQVDLVAWAQDSADELNANYQPLNEERFAIRRGRVRVEAHQDALSGALELDGNTLAGSTARLVAATATYTIAPIAITAGLLRTPFGAEVQTTDRTKPFLEPPAFARALFPGSYDAGVVVSGQYSVLRWAAGIVNGAPVGDAQWKGVDPLSSYDFVGRVGAVVPLPRKWRVEAGVSGLSGSGFHPGQPPTKDELQWVDENLDGIVQPVELHIVPGGSGEPSMTFDRAALGADVAVHWCLCGAGNGVAYVEAVVGTNLDRGLVYADPIASSRDLRHSGFQVGVVQDLTKYARLGVRYDRYDADRDAKEVEGLSLVAVHKTFTTWSIMATGRLGDARLILQYDKQRNPFGRGDDGAPTTFAADRLTLRAQVGF